MAITTEDQAIAGMQWPRRFNKAVTATLVAGRPASTWALGGLPGAGSYDTTLAGVALSSSSSLVNGQIHFNDPASGSAYLARMVCNATQAGTVLLVDRLWHNGGITITNGATAQTVNSATFPARDVNESTDGLGVLCALEVSAATGAGTPTLTLTYTNSSGTGSRTTTNIIATVASSAIGATYFFGLQAGDYGIRSIQSYQQSASWTSGTVNLVAYRVIAEVELSAAFVPNAIDVLTGGLAKMPNGAVPYLIFLPSTTTATNISGSVIYTHG